MKKFDWFKYLFLIILIIGLLIFERYIDFRISRIVALTMQPVKYYNLEYAMSTVICLLIGGLLGVECFLVERKKDGKWRFKWVRAIVLLIPSIFFVLPPYILFKCFYPLSMFMSWGGNFSYLSILRVLVGYWLITSFYKQREKSSIIKDNQI